MLPYDTSSIFLNQMDGWVKRKKGKQADKKKGRS